MRLRISSKLVLAFLGLTLLVLIATLGLARWSFERGFLDYVNALELDRLERAATNFAQDYVAGNESWATLSEEQFLSLIQGARGPGPSGRPPPPNGGRRGRAAPPHRRPNLRGPPTSLVDKDGRYLAGEQITLVSTDSIRVPIVVNDVAVGALISQPRRQFTSAPETAFARQQLRASWLTGAASLILALAVSTVLARGLLAPIRRMIDNVERLSGGDYTARLTETRQDELGQLMSNLDRLGVTLEKSQSARRRWLADISHELRTPVTVLTGELQALRDGLRTFDHAQAESLEQEVQRLRYLIDDLYELSVSDVGGLRYEFAPVDLGQLLDAVITSARARTADRGIDIVAHIEEGIGINADAKRIDQLLHNVLENSLAYTDAPGQIKVTLSQSNGHAQLDIQDTPPGVTRQDCAQLFDPLYRQDASRSRRTGGAGLGLAICKKIVEAHSGDISALPSPLGGLCIRIVFPADDLVVK